MLVTKTYSVDCAHQLDLPYESKCNRLHGHTYTITIGVDQTCDPSTGIVVDYNDFPKDKVLELDHKFLVAAKHVMYGDHREYGIQIAGYEYSMPHEDVYLIGANNTTAEAIAAHLFKELMKSGFHCAFVEVKETGSSSARYDGSS